jgi:large subunit ribosomal protein L7/L12
LIQSCDRGAAVVRPLVVLAALAASGLATGCGDEVDVMITEVGDRPAAVIREVRAANGIGLQEAKLLLSGVPSAVVEDVPREEGEALERRLEKAGATVELD